MSEDVERPMPAESRGEAPARGRLTGRRILVVGGGQDTRGLDDPPIGNGRAMCLLFAREGAKVAVADRPSPVCPLAWVVSAHWALALFLEGQEGIIAPTRRDT